VLVLVTRARVAWVSTLRTKILPATFLVIVATVTRYGLTASPVARLLGVTRPARSRPLLVGDAPWAVDLGRVLQSAGLDVLMWAGPQTSARPSAGPGWSLPRRAARPGHRPRRRA
jgi:hypothetical protein